MNRNFIIDFHPTSFSEKVFLRILNAFTLIGVVYGAQNFVLKDEKPYKQSSSK